jgi:hypothetical protein
MPKYNTINPGGVTLFYIKETANIFKRVTPSGSAALCSIVITGFIGGYCWESPPGYCTIVQVASPVIRLPEQCWLRLPCSSPISRN